MADSKHSEVGIADMVVIVVVVDIDNVRDIAYSVNMLVSVLPEPL